jgi:hypothetical protein
MISTNSTSGAFEPTSGTPEITVDEDGRKEEILCELQLELQ